MKYSKIILLAVGVFSLVGMACFFSFREKPAVEREGVTYKSKAKETRKGKNAIRNKSTANRRIKRVITEKVKPTFDLEDEEEAKLTAAQKELLEEIRKALDDDDKNEVLRLVRKLQRSKEWPDGIPKAIKMASIEALGWFGGLSSLPELVGFLADLDQEVIQATIEKFEEALSDFELSDRERAAILVEASKVINDSDAMDMMLFELSNMRNSVAIDTIKKLMAEGGEATKAVLPDNVEFFTGEEGLDTPDKLDEWLKNNPDDEDDEEFYKGMSYE